MSEASLTDLQEILDRLRAGDRAARDDLFRHASARLERLTRSMLRDYPGVHRWEQTADVYQNAVVRLCRALQEVAPPTPRDFYRLAALQIRRELVDMARHYYGPQGGGAHHASGVQGGDESGERPPAYDAGGLSLDPSGLALWTEFHRQAEALPPEEREVFDLLWYQGLKQEEAAAVVGVTTRTIKSRWRAARLKLHTALGGTLPGL